MANIVELRDSTNTKSYPLTKAQAVYFDDGMNANKRVLGIMDTTTHEVPDTTGSIFSRITTNANFMSTPADSALVKEEKYKIVFTPNTSFTIDSIQIGTAGSAAGMVDTLATNITFTSGTDFSIDYVAPISGLRYLRVPESNNNFESVVAYKYEMIAKDEVYVSPEMFGAVGDGVTNDTNALQACIDYAAIHHIAVKCPCNKTYSIRRLIVCNWRNIDFNHCTLKSNYTSGTNAGQMPVLLVDNDNEHDPLDADPINGWHGSIRNLIIDGNNATRCGLRVAKDWRGDYENIYVFNLFPGVQGGISIAYQIQSAGGSYFHILRGRGSGTGYDMFMQMTAVDTMFDFCDFQAFRYGIYNGATSRYINIHGYVANNDIYDDSYFMYLRESCFATLLYPDTQKYCFVIARANNYLLSEINIAFNTNVVTPTEDQAYIFYIDESAGGSVENVRIVNGMFALSDARAGVYNLCNVSGLPITSSIIKNVGNYDVSG